MTHSVVRTESLQEQELKQKQAELAALESELAERELELATLQAELHAYDTRYLKKFGAKSAELDRLHAEIAKLRAKLHPDDPAAQKQARQARARARKSAQREGDKKAAQAVREFQPDEDLKKLYRAAAKKIHPDLVTDETERARRTVIMADMNRAYQEGDAVKLRAILQQWESGPDSVQGDGLATALLRVTRKITQVRERLDAIAAQMTKAKRIHKMIPLGEQAQAEQDAFFAILSDKLDREIAAALQRLTRLKKQAKSVR